MVDDLPSVTELVAVAALHLSHVAWLRALLGDVTLLVTVAASDHALLLTLLGTVALLATVAADIWLTARAVAGEVACILMSAMGADWRKIVNIPISLQFLHSTPSAERGSVQSLAM